MKSVPDSNFGTATRTSSSTANCRRHEETQKPETALLMIEPDRQMLVITAANARLQPGPLDSHELSHPAIATQATATPILAAIHTRLATPALQNMTAGAIRKIALPNTKIVVPPRASFVQSGRARGATLLAMGDRYE